jgi:hypothetical protein
MKTLLPLPIVKLSTIKDNRFEMPVHPQIMLKPLKLKLIVVGNTIAKRLPIFISNVMVGSLSAFPSCGDLPIYAFKNFPVYCDVYSMQGLNVTGWIDKSELHYYGYICGWFECNVKSFKQHREEMKKEKKQ